MRERTSQAAFYCAVLRELIESELLDPGFAVLVMLVEDEEVSKSYVLGNAPGWVAAMILGDYNKRAASLASLGSFLVP